MVKTHLEELKDLVRAGASVPAIEDFIDGRDLPASLLKVENRRELLFLACSFGHLHLVQWLLQGEYAVPLLAFEEPNNRTVLHVAVATRQYDIVEWLLGPGSNVSYREIVKLLCTRCLISRRHGGRAAGTHWTPLSHAVKVRDRAMLSLLLSYTTMGWQVVPELRDVFQEARTAADPYFKDLLDKASREADVEYFCKQYLCWGNSLQDLKNAVAAFDWWHEHARPWTDKERFHLYLALRRSAAKGLTEEVTWLLSELVVAFERPENVLDTGASVADWAALGEELIHEIINGAKPKPLDSWSENVLFHCWNTDTSLRSYFEVQLAGSFAGKEDISYERKFFLESSLKRLRDDTHSSRVLVLQALIEQKGSAGLPRLDFLVLADRLEILQWLVSKGYIDLHARFSGERPEELEQESIVKVGQPDDECAICLEPKRNPTNLPCSHSFCRTCLLQHFGRQENWEHACCPLCRGSCALHALQPGNNMLESFEKSLCHSAPWLIETCGMGGRKLVEVMLGLAVGAGAIRVAAWILAEHDLGDAKLLRFNEGDNLMHLAISRGQAYIVKYLAESNFHELAKTLNDKGCTPVHEAARHSMASILRYFGQKGWWELLDSAGQNWTYYAKESSSKEMQELVKEYLATSVWEELLKALADEAPLEHISNLVTSTDLFRHVVFDDARKTLFCSFVQSVFRRGRVDVLRWMYIFHESIAPRAIGRHDLFSTWGRQLASSSASREEEFCALFAEIHTVKEVHKKCHGRRDEFNRLFDRGAPVKELVDIWQAQDAAIATVPTDLKSKFKYMNPHMDRIMMHGLIPLEYATYLHHPHIVEWLLVDKYSADSNEALRTLHVACSCGSIQVVRWLVPWMIENDIDPDAQPSVRPSGQGQAGQKGVNGEEFMDNAFHTALRTLVISTYLANEQTMEDAPGDTSEQNIADRESWEVLEYLAGHPAVNVNGPNQRGDHALKWLIGSATLLISNGEPREEFILGLLKLLERSGIDIPEATSCEENLVDTMANFGCMEVVSWLAMELEVNIQHLSPRFDIYDPFTRDEQLQEAFSALQVAQRQQLAKATRKGRRRRNRRRDR